MSSDDTWGPGWTSSLSFLALVDFIFMTWALLELKKVHGQAKRSQPQARKMYFLAIAQLSCLRCISFILWLYVAVNQKSGKYYFILILILDTCAVLFCYIFTLMLVFWHHFYSQIFFVGASSDKAVTRRFLFLLTVTSLFLGVNFVVSVFLLWNMDGDAYFYWQLVGFFVLLSSMILQTLVYFWIGFKIYSTLKDPYTNYPLSSLSSDSKKVIGFSLIATLLNIIRLSLIIFSLIYIIENGVSGESLSENWVTFIVKWRIYSVGWRFYLVYYLLIEDVSIILMMYFVTRLPDQHHDAILKDSMIDSNSFSSFSYYDASYSTRSPDSPYGATSAPGTPPQILVSPPLSARG